MNLLTMFKKLNKSESIENDINLDEQFKFGSEA